MTRELLTERQRRERSYYDEFSRRTERAEITFDPVSGREQRPWNPHWCAYDVALRRRGTPVRRLLDFGCGGGRAAVRFAHVGFEVSGFDISAHNVELARALAERNTVSDRVHLDVMSAEELQYPDEHFDVIAGFDILHHVEIGRAVPECMRVLRPGGIAVFAEPLEVPAFDRLRNTALVRRLVPNEMSFERHITADEHKLTAADLRLIASLTSGFTVRRFLLTARADRFIPRGNPRAPSMLERVDHWLIRLLPALERFGGYGVLTFTKD